MGDYLYVIGLEHRIAELEQLLREASNTKTSEEKAFAEEIERAVKKLKTESDTAFNMAFEMCKSAVEQLVLLAESAPYKSRISSCAILFEKASEDIEKLWQGKEQDGNE